MYFQVVKQPKTQGQTPAQPEVYVVEEGELMHFLHENLRPDVVLVFTEFPERNLYTLSNDKD
ncbi:hypothetical protein [Dipodfec virus UOA04_Rod_446]|nr:hypothetical protein [Dipodfec virus UOA04_Rod_446]